MSLFGRYLFARVLATTALALVIASAIFLTTQVMYHLPALIESGSSLAWIGLAAMLLPSVLVAVMPLALLIGVCRTYATSAADSEMIVAAASGRSPLATAAPALAVGLVAATGCLATGLFVEPWANRMVRNIVATMSADAVRLAALPGSFRPLDRDVFVRIGSRESGGGFADIMIVDQRQGEPQRIYLARRGRILETDGPPVLFLTEGELQVRGAEDVYPSLISFSAYTLDLTTFGPAQARPATPRQSTTAELLTADRSPAARAELARRFSEWLYVLATAALSAAALGRPAPARATRFLPLLAAAGSTVLVRAAGFVALGGAGASDAALLVLFATPLAAAAVGLAVLRSDRAPSEDVITRLAMRHGRTQYGASP